MIIMKKLLMLVLGLFCFTAALPLATLRTAGEEETGVPAPVRAWPTVAESGLPAADEPGFDRDSRVTVWWEGECRELSLRDYLIGVVAAEMPAGFPEAALRAQAVAARTYVLYKLALYSTPPTEHHGAQLCADPGHCEAFCDLTVQAAQLWGGNAALYTQRIAQAVDETAGQILTWQGQPIAAVFCAASAEMTESAADVWGRDIPYLINVESPGGSDCSQYDVETAVPRAEFETAVRQALPSADLSGSPSQWFQNVQRSPAGGVKTLTLGGAETTGAALRSLFSLPSANFTAAARGDQVIFHTTGYGHGVGLSQYGARYYALAGRTYADILCHYYPGTKLETRTDPV